MGWGIQIKPQIVSLSLELEYPLEISWALESLWVKQRGVSIVHILEDTGPQHVNTQDCAHTLKKVLPTFSCLLPQDTFTVLSLARFWEAPGKTHMSFVFFFLPSPNILPNRSNGFRKGLLARMSHRVSLLGKKKKLETEMCIRSVLYIERVRHFDSSSKP